MVDYMRKKDAQSTLPKTNYDRLDRDACSAFCSHLRQI